MRQLVDLARAPQALLTRLRALNDAHAEQTSPLTPEALAGMCRAAFAAWAPEDGSAFLIAFDESADYASPNFRWFRDRYDRFVYVDRIVVAGDRRGEGMGRQLYAALFEAARASGRARVACEVNRVPPNPVSDAFHARMGFARVGEGGPAPGKTVRYLLRPLDTGGPAPIPRESD
ncbi:GNAT family N-acetyltransferase [Rhodosalinus sp.]|uniref:GNAT family N-acetyltransferase n=1 Tax=Rhodosalinus sp. TaxID=2047741 RepID=UPI00397BAFA7